MAQSAAKHPRKLDEGSTSRAYDLNQPWHGYEAHDWRHRRHGDDVLYSTLRNVADSHLVVKRIGKNAIPFTRKYEELAQVGVRKDIVTILSNDAAKVLDTAAEAQFDACKVRYNATGTAAGYFSTSGTDSYTASSQMNLTHAKAIIDYMFQTMKCEPYDGEDFMSIMSTDAKRGVYDAVESIIQYTKYPSSGEFGRYYDCRMVKTNHGLSNTIGASSAYGEAYFFGANDPVIRGMAVPMNVIEKEVTDFQRSRGLAWYCIEAYRLRKNGNPDNEVVKFGSL